MPYAARIVLDMLVRQRTIIPDVTLSIEDIIMEMLLFQFRDAKDVHVVATWQMKYTLG